jgi:hypothetical protein
MSVVSLKCEAPLRRDLGPEAARMPVPVVGLLCVCPGAAAARADASRAGVAGSLQAGALSGLPSAGAGYPVICQRIFCSAKGRLEATSFVRQTPKANAGDEMDQVAACEGSS